MSIKNKESIKVPALPESVTDATVVEWFVPEKKFVKQDTKLVDLETEKVILEVNAPEDGYLEKILIPGGALVKTDEELAVFVKSEAQITTTQADTQVSDSVSQANVQTSAEEINTEPSTALGRLGRLFSGSGPAARRKEKEPLTEVNTTTDSNQTASIAVLEPRSTKRVPMTRIRAKIAERLLEVQAQTASLTTFSEINLKKVMELRTDSKESFEQKYGVRLGFMSLFTKAAVAALKQFPEVNASIESNEIIYYNYYDIGIAVSTDRGLMVPVVRNADQLSLAEIEKAIRDYSDKARKNRITLDELTGGTFTITNGGVFGSLLSTPIINAPQSAILGMHKIEERPIVENGSIVIRPMMYLALTYDHRIIDGKESVQFLATIKNLLENPAKLLLDI